MSEYTPNLGLHSRGPVSTTVYPEAYATWDYDENMEIIDRAYKALADAITVLGVNIGNASLDAGTF